MKQYAKVFYKECLGDSKVAQQLNTFLTENPAYSISHIDYNKDSGSCAESLFVVFNVEETTISDNHKIERITFDLPI